MRIVAPLIASAITIAALAGCASTGGTTAATGAQPSAVPSSAPSSEPSAAAAPSSAPCTTRACIVADAKTLVGSVDKGNAVLTKMSCRKSTAKKVAPGVYTVHCNASYSDGGIWAGIASVLLEQGKVTWEATSAIRYGEGD